MITGGEDALYIARRLVVVASEDVGLADNHALPLVRDARGAEPRELTAAGDGNISSLSTDRFTGMSDQSGSESQITPMRLSIVLIMTRAALRCISRRGTKVNTIVYSICQSGCFDPGRHLIPTHT